jgi:fatty acid CoA ligase FadD9
MLREDPEVQRSSFSESALAEIRKCPSSIESLAAACRLYGDRPSLARRAFEPAPNGDGPVHYVTRFHAITYAELWGRVEALASGLARTGLAETGKLVGICGFGSVDWAVADFACLYLAATSVPLQTGMMPADLEHILHETELTCVVCSVEQLALMEAVLPHSPSVRSVVIMDFAPEDRPSREEVARRKERMLRRRPDLVIRTLQEVESAGREQGSVPMVLPSQLGGDPLMTLMYTSGSTGTPKGAMFPESLWIKTWHAGTWGPHLPALPHVGVSYNPLNHAAGRHQLIGAILRGGVTSFVLRSDMSSLFEDIRLVRPTNLFLVPRVAGMIYQHFQSELVKRASGSEEQGSLEEQIMAEMRTSFLGDRLLLLSVGSAPTPREVVSFLRRCFLVPVFDGYGSTEAGLIARDGRIDRSVVTAYRLVDVPELGYRSTDTPHARGALHVKTVSMIPGYYRNRKATKDLYDDEGYLDTGDIVELHGPDEVVWLDRAKNVLKLAQGEFVATSRLEGLYASRSPFIQQIYLYGKSVRSYLLAVVVPEMDAAILHLRRQGKKPEGDGAIKELVRAEIDRIAAEEGLHGFEVPRDFLLELSPFTVENGLLTESRKPSRPKLLARYGGRLEQLYAAIERAQLEQLHALRGGAGDAALVVKRALEIALGLRDIDPRTATQSFVRLGGDSLSAVQLGSLIEEACGVSLPVGFLLDPSSSVRAIVERLAAALGGAGAPRVTFADVHGAGATVVRADDLRLDRFLRKEELDAWSARPREAPREAKVVLLTGANGFLGRFLLLELLRRLPEGGRVHCVVRAPDDVAAAARLRDAFDGVDPALVDTFARFAAGGRLWALAGDLMKPRLGLSEEAYARLTGEVDCVVHNGALVNHAFSYPQLFEPNVLGTVEVIRFALERRTKSLSYVSTVGVPFGADHPGPMLEDEDPRSLCRERPIDSGYAVGYGTSKWASEVLLREAHERLGLPVNVLRPSAILAHRRFRGQINVPDWFTRLLHGVVHTGVAPRSFSPGSRPPHVDGLPVDVVARSIAAIALDLRFSAEEARGVATYHVVNPYRDDGISLDAVMDWVQTAGYPVERVDDYRAWITEFRKRLSALSDAEKQRSPLPILQQWERPASGRGALVLDCQRLLERLGALSARPGDEDLALLPHIDEAFIHKYLDDMVALGLIEPPAPHVSEKAA